MENHCINYLCTIEQVSKRVESSTSVDNTTYTPTWQVRRNGDLVDKKHDLQLIGFEYKMYMFMESSGYDWKNKTDQVSFNLKFYKDVGLIRTIFSVKKVEVFYNVNFAVYIFKLSSVQLYLLLKPERSYRCLIFA